MTKSCKDCVFVAVDKILDAYSVYKCDYPVPEWLKIRVSGGNYLSGYEAQTCVLYKTKVDLINETKSK